MRSSGGLTGRASASSILTAPGGPREGRDDRSCGDLRRHQPGGNGLGGNHEAARPFVAVRSRRGCSSPIHRSDEPIIYVNAAFERMTGYTQKEAAGREIAWLKGRQTDSAAIAAIEAAFDHGDECSVEMCLDRKTARRSVFAGRLARRDPAGRVTHFVGVMTDITDQKEARRARRGQGGRRGRQPCQEHLPGQHEP